MIKHLLILFVLFQFTGTTYAQDSNTVRKPDMLRNVEQAPKPGYDLNQYLSTHVHYPNQAIQENVAGRVYIRFAVDNDGSICDYILVKGIGSGCDEEALRLIKDMPKWQPGMRSGKPYKIYITLPITFSLTS